MERLVDYDKFIMEYGVLSNHEDDYRLLCAAKITAYTKDEVIAMLTDLRLEIEKIFDNRPLPCSHYQRTLFYGEVDDLILDKINELKGESEEKE